MPFFCFSACHYVLDAIHVAIQALRQIAVKTVNTTPSETPARRHRRDGSYGPGRRRNQEHPALFDSESFDEVAAMAGIPYCRSLDLYLDRQTYREAGFLSFHLAHMALTH